MKATVPSSVEQRYGKRVAAQAPARFESPAAFFGPSGPAMVEDYSISGLRLRTETRLRPGDALIVKVSGEPVRLHARVLWVREAPPSHAGGRMTCIAGCRLEPQSMGRVRIGAAFLEVRTPFRWWLLAIGGVIGMMAALAYACLRFVTFT
jgi:hypothetical protein